MTASFELEGSEFTALNGGPQFKFTEAISFFVNCETQEEVDDLLGQALGGRPDLSSAAGSRTSSASPGRSSRPSLPKLLSDPDPAKANRVMQAMLQMKKIDIAKLEQAYKG